MLSTRKSLDLAGIMTMAILCAFLGLQQVAIKFVAGEIAPIMQIALRSGISAVLVVIYVTLKQEKLFSLGKTLQPGLLLGALFSLEFLFIAEGLRFTSASHMVVFLYTAPIFTALTLQRFLPAERLQPFQWLGIAIAFGGIVTAFLGSAMAAGISGQMLFGDLLALFGGAAWASTTVTIRCSKLTDAPAAQTLLYQLLAAFILLLLYSFATGQAGMSAMTGIAWSSLLFQGIIITFVVYLAWFSLLRRYHSAQLSPFLFLTPLFGVTYGVLLLDDALDGWFAGGALMVLGGLVLVSLPRLQRHCLTKSA